MLESILLLGEKAAGLLSWLMSKLRRPRIADNAAPQNLFEQFGPGTSIERMKEMLGAPYKTNSGQFGYKFRDAFVQVESADGISVSTIAVALPRLSWRARFTVYPHPANLALGKATLGDVLEMGMEIQYESSSKMGMIYLTTSYGFPSLYRGFTFGVVHAPLVAGADYDWDHNNKRLITDPCRIRLNWVAVSLASNEKVLFNYWLFL